MTKTRKIVLDVLKPHQPNALEFASVLADLAADYRVRLVVTEVDKKTESTIVTIEGLDIRYEEIRQAVEQMGGSIHSIDEVDVQGSSPEAS